MDQFTYHSKQHHNINGITKETIVNINNGKGVKIVKKGYGNKIILNKQPLTKKEIKKIRNNQFIPGLFRLRPNNKTRRLKRK
jgi:hypothetical protein